MALVAVSLLGGANAAMAQGTALEERGELRERYAPSADISGSAVIGLVAARAGPAVPNAIIASIPAGWAGQDICARMVSSDGRYDATRPFFVPAAWPAGLARLDIPTRFEAQLNALEEVALGVAVSLGDCDQANEERQFVPAAWGSAALGETLLLLVNSFRADEAYLYFPESGADVDCAPAAIEARTAFDMVCPLPAELVAQGGAQAAELNRVRRGTMMGSDYFTIDLR
ncbi:hypothetical protein O9Z70_12830 [Devosia sp. YIM 151766]|uniref:hypothetical protein n=1 Tax=Devosia sp. YIM 151766 TaxID=3017325 RepID=UPI00255C7F55|nr:hypothetical protein [Devosia sp. YIM 151766]WIY52338.1 hypothetical protein O9Z70_12830 [Devosia sp. YIM 151766]